MSSHVLPFRLYSSVIVCNNFIFPLKSESPSSIKYCGLGSGVGLGAGLGAGAGAGTRTSPKLNCFIAIIIL